MFLIGLYQCELPKKETTPAVNGVDGAIPATNGETAEGATNATDGDQTGTLGDPEKEPDTFCAEVLGKISSKIVSLLLKHSKHSGKTVHCGILRMFM